MKKPEQVDELAKTQILDRKTPPAADSDDETQELRTLSAEEIERKLAERKPPKP